jgi:tetratricopeptide (TPR) repeat protein
MRLSSKIIAVLVLTHIYFIGGCGNKESSSPFDELLSLPPFASLTDSIKKQPKRDELYFRRAILLNKNNFPEPALADFQKAWSLKKNEQYALGVATLLSEKKSDSAIQFLNKVLKEIPQSILLYLSLARAYDAQNKTDNALLVCNKILQINSDQLDALAMKADLLEKINDIPEAIITLEKAYSIAPSIADLSYNLAYKYAESKNLKVVAFCDSLIKKDSLGEHAEPYYCKGIYYSNINDKAKALALFNEAIQHDHNFMSAYIEKGRVFYDQKKYIEARKIFLQTLTISSTLADAYYWLGKCQEALGEKEEARLNYQRAYGLDKTFTEAKEAADKLGN